MSALDFKVTYTDIVTPWAPVGAKNVHYTVCTSIYFNFIL